MPSLRSKLMSVALRRYVRPRLMRLSIDEHRRSSAARARLFRVPHGTKVEPVSADNVSGEWISPVGAAQDNVLFYLHGGGFCTGSSTSCRHFNIRLAQAIGARAITIDYRLAPEYPFPAAVEDSLAAYHWLLDNGLRAKNIVMGGDSAGGNLAMATLVALRNGGEPLPAAAFCLSPALDMAMTGESLTTRAAADPIFTREYVEWVAPLYVGSGDPRNPLMSPL